MIRNWERVAEEDIKCYVLLRDEEYEIPYPGVSINDKLKIRIIGDVCYGGFPSYKRLEDLERFIKYLGDKTNLTIGEATIPKGSKYMEGTKGYSFPSSKEYIELVGFMSNKLEIKKEKEID